MTRTVFSSLRNKALFISAGALFALAVPAAAVTAATTPARPSTASPQDRARTEQPSERRICVREALTGSRMVRRICKTEREWEAEGGPSD